MPRNQLLDVLFKLFQDQDYWPIRALRERTQQPEVYLKEVLSEIATLHRSGEHAGSYELREAFTENGVKGEGMNAAALYAMPPKTEYDEEEEEDDDEDDMEEVA
jgi:transcription initiation factor TFIIF subunit beta